MNEVNAPKCGRENNLLDFLYGEMNDVEAETFQLHLKDCGECSAELAAFKNVRESVVAWRNESLGVLTSPSQIKVSPVVKGINEQPSALAALREFFNLSPLWLKGAVAFASILFCLFAGLAIARLRDKPAPMVVTTPGGNGYSEQDVDALVNLRVRDELQRIRKSTQPQPVAPVMVDNGPGRTPGPQVAKRRTEVAVNFPSQKLRRPLSKTERQQLAADLRLTSAKNESDLDLLGDHINQ